MVELSPLRKIRINKVCKIKENLIACLPAVSVSQLMEIVDIEHDNGSTAYRAVSYDYIHISGKSLFCGKTRYLMRRTCLLIDILNFVHSRQVEDASRYHS